MGKLNLIKILKTGAVLSVLALSGLTAMAQGHGGPFKQSANAVARGLSALQL